jgi:hypothetical protein
MDEMTLPADYDLALGRAVIADRTAPPLLSSSLTDHTHGLGRAIAQAVSRWLPTAAARVWPCGICGGQTAAGAGFLRVLRFPLPIFIPPIAPQSPSFIIWGL